MMSGLVGLTAIASPRPFQIDEPAAIPLGPSGFHTTPLILLTAGLAMGGPPFLFFAAMVFGRITAGAIALHCFIPFWYASAGIGTPPNVRSVVICWGPMVAS